MNEKKKKYRVVTGQGVIVVKAATKAAAKMKAARQAQTG